MSPKGHLPGRPPGILVIGRTLRASSHTHYWEDPEKGRAASRVSSRASYWRNPGKKRAAVCITNLKAARAKLKWYRQYYAKHGKGICGFRRGRYALARFCNRIACKETTEPAIGYCWG